MAEVFLFFEQFVSVCENEEHRQRKYEMEDFSALFQSAVVIEELCRKACTEDAKEIFESKLQEWMKMRKWKHVYKVEFFEKACDQLLRKYLLILHNVEKIRSFTQCYVDICGERRLHAAVKDGIVGEVSSVVALDAFDKVVKQLKDKDSVSITVDVWLVIFHWSRESKTNDDLRRNITCFWDEVVKSKNIFEMILQVTLINLDDLRRVQVSIVEFIVSKLNETGAGEMWELFVGVKSDTVLGVCDRYLNFLSGFVEFLDLIGKKFSCEYSNSGYKWTVVSNARNDNDFEVFIKFVKTLVNGNRVVQSAMLERLHKLQREKGAAFWEEVEEHCHC